MTTTLNDLRNQHGATPPRAATMNEIVQLKPDKQFPAMLDAFKSQIAVALPAHLSPDRMARIALTAFRTNKTLQQCSPTSLFQAVIISAQLGLEIGIDGQAYLVPRRNKGKWEAVLIPGWKGYVELVNRAGKAGVWTGAVFKGDAFEYELGDRPFVRHKPMGECDETKANLTHVYSVGRVHGAENPVIEVWPIGKIERHLKKYNNVGDSHYALANDNNFIQYGKKVALLQVQKYLPKSVELRAAEAIEAHGSANVNLKDVIEGDWLNVTDQVQAGDGEEPTGNDSGAAGAIPSSESPAGAEQGGDAGQATAASESTETTKKPGRQRRTIE